MADSTINVLSLCSGTGMLEEGLRAGLEFLGYRSRVLGYVERDAYAAACLLERMASAALEPSPVFCGNLEELDAGSFRGFVDIVCAGFPCQPWSTAGKREGTDDSRWLWPAIARIIRDTEPALVYCENVPGLISGGGVHFVLDDLAEMGFDAEWGHLTAASVGASHKRERVFMLGISRREQWRRDGGLATQPSRNGTHDGIPGAAGGDVALSPLGGLGELRQPPERDGQPDGSDGAVDYSAHGEHERQQEATGEREQRINPEPGGTVGDTQRDGGRLDQPGRGSDRGTAAGRAGAVVGDTDGSGRREQCDGDWGIFAPGPSDPRWSAILAERPWLAPAIERGFLRVVDGLAVRSDEHRADRLRAIGNGVVPLQAAAAFVELFKRLNDNKPD